MNLCPTWSTKQYSVILPLLFRPSPVCLQSVFLDGPSMLEFRKKKLPDTPSKLRLAFLCNGTCRPGDVQHVNIEGPSHTSTISYAKKIRSNTIIQHQRMQSKRPCRHQKYFRLILSRLVREECNIRVHEHMIAHCLHTTLLAAGNPAEPNKNADCGFSD